MTSPKAEELYSYVQERCLWQFFSRSWDRTENIEGVLSKVTDLLTGIPLVLKTPLDRLFYADAKVLAENLRLRFPALEGLEATEVRDLIGQVKERVTDLAVTQSRNRELTQKLY